MFPARRAWAAVRRGVLDINALMVVAVAGAVAIGEWEEGAMVVFLFAVAQWLESRSVDRARAAIRSLLDLAPPQARIAGDGPERLVPIEAVTPGQVLVVKPGERVPLDGTVQAGRSDVNQAPITGESVPVEKVTGDEVYAGTINGHGSLSITVTHRRDDTTLARIIHLVEEAQSARAPLQQFIDRFAARYTPAVVVLAALIGIVPILAGGEPATWIYRALVVLVVACPCALVISTPVSMVSALAGAARQGVLIKGGAALERLARVTTLAFDKTGTLTRGEVAVGAVVPMPGVTEARLLGAAAAVERHSEHPIARAIVHAAHASGLAVPEATGVRALPGLGVEGMVEGETVWCATPRYLDERGVATDDVRARAARMVGEGLSPVVVVAGATPIGLIGVADRERDAARGVVADVRRHGIARVAMLTGDTRASADRVGARVGRRGARELLPADQVAAVSTSARRRRPWSVTASTMRPPSPPTSASSWAPSAATPPSRPPTSPDDRRPDAHSLRARARPGDGAQRAGQRRHRARPQAGLRRRRRRRRRHAVDGRPRRHRGVGHRPGQRAAAAVVPLVGAGGPGGCRLRPDFSSVKWASTKSSIASGRRRRRA